METAFHVLVNFEPRYREAYAAFFWPANTVLISLLFAAVISLIYQATETAPTRRLLRFLVIATAVLIPAVTFAIQYTGKGPHGKWLTPWTSNLDFCAAILDLALWMIAIGSKKADRLVLRLSGALGIQFAGEAIGYSIRALATPSHSLPLVWVGNTVLLFASLPCLYFWWQAFRSPAPSARRTAV